MRLNYFKRDCLNEEVNIIFFVSFSTYAYENCTSGNSAELEECFYDNYKQEDNALIIYIRL